jgi:hypothetical protein
LESSVYAGGVTAPAPGSPGQPRQPDQTDRLAERYGVRSGRRWPLIAVATVVGAVLLGWLAWTAIFHATPQVSSELVGWEVVDDHEVVARVQVDIGDDVVGECRIRAMAEDHTVVGEVAFEVADDADGTVVEQPIRTERLATTVERIGCTAPDQPRPR